MKVACHVRDTNSQETLGDTYSYVPDLHTLVSNSLHQKEMVQLDLVTCIDVYIFDVSLVRIGES